MNRRLDKSSKLTTPGATLIVSTLIVSSLLVGGSNLEGDVIETINYGPNFDLISEYVEQVRAMSIDDPVIVEYYKTRNSFILKRGRETFYDENDFMREWASREEALAWARENSLDDDD